ncbi:25349_t:CDS:2 [Gigaspora margarita]|uniref:25349_t:CDS:1 n=1 Tax=Gigaspora margarita TaxID=4874 RepID=A0ABN7VRJ7_GIGMA|nr:25349_t:CDS:2 [Gigaspora margarita]
MTVLPNMAATGGKASLVKASNAKFLDAKILSSTTRNTDLDQSRSESDIVRFESRSSLNNR